MAISTIGTDALASAAVTSAKLASGVPSRSQLPAGTVLQVVTLTKSDSYTESISPNSISSSTVASFTASITPTSATSKILVLVTTNLGSSSADSTQGNGVGFVLTRNGTSIAIGDASSNRSRLTSSAHATNVIESSNVSANYVDSPATTSSTSYSVKLFNGAGATATITMNRGYTDPDASYAPRDISTMTLMEIAA